MNTTSILKLVACLAWAGVAVSIATPASAVAITYQSGAYANCAASSYAQMGFHCSYMSGGEQYFRYETYYMQQIKFVTTGGCNSGSCNSDSSEVHVESVYATGRKNVSSTGATCAKNVYGLGTCAC